MKLNRNFLGGGRVQNKKPSVGGEYGHFLELHISEVVEKNIVNLAI